MSHQDDFHQLFIMNDGRNIAGETFDGPVNSVGSGLATTGQIEQYQLVSGGKLGLLVVPIGEVQILSVNEE